MNLGKLSVGTFLRGYWQQQPLLIKNAFPNFIDPITPEELAGLACEEGVDARLVFTRKHNWELKSGPFKERDFTTLSKRNWTLLVQAVDQFVPEVKALLHEVAFLPNWRIDDVMISYATPNGGVGPHFDYYDVFLLQGLGNRIWKTGQHCTTADINRTNSGLKLLGEFNSEQEWLLEPGDVLYVPPGIAHWGVSVDNSLCYSIGFRAPSVSEMVLSYSDAVSDKLTADQRYQDPKLKNPLLPGEINSSALQHMRRLLKQALSDELEQARWFGCYMTTPTYPELIFAPAAIPDLGKGNINLTTNPSSRFAWQQLDDEVLVFTDGQCLQLPASPLLRRLLLLLPLVNTVFTVKPFCKHKVCRSLLTTLLAQGSLLVTDRLL